MRLSHPHTAQPQKPVVSFPLDSVGRLSGIIKYLVVLDITAPVDSARKVHERVGASDEVSPVAAERDRRCTVSSESTSKLLKV